MMLINENGKEIKARKKGEKKEAIIQTMGASKEKMRYNLEF